jgi:hypothetical protein
VLLVGLAVAYVSQLGHQSAITAATTATSTPAKAQATAPRVSQQPTTATSAPPTTAAPTATPAPNPDIRLGSFLSSYYAEVTKNTALTWGQLTPAMQQRAGGRGGYNGFWSSIAGVTVNSTQADAAGTSAVVSLTFTKTNGVTSNETHRFTFVSQNGSYLIDSDKGPGQ